MEVVTEENIKRIEEELLSDRWLKLKEIFFFFALGPVHITVPACTAA
jgi:hypothetical protein